ncbi:hypothetical protein KKG56_09405, partial [bacterium]|nr:hypothetical protein [bacterium]
TNPKLSIINIAGLIIQELKQKEIVTYSELLSSLINQTSESAKEVFLYANSFLFLLDKIEYISNLDSLRLKGHEN